MKLENPMRLVRRLLLLALMAFTAPMASAVYNTNIRGTLDFVAVYSDGDYIYFRLTNQPTSHPTCNPGYFVIPETVPENRRNQMYAGLLAVKMAGESVEIGYDNQGDCAHGFIRAHRVG